MPFATPTSDADFPAVLFWLFVIGIPLGLWAAAYWARRRAARRRSLQPKVPPGDPTNPV
jgi:hypothetical protein